MPTQKTTPPPTADSQAELRLGRSSTVGPMLLVLALVVVVAAMFFVLASRRNQERAASVPRDLDAAEGELRAHYDAALEYLILLEEDMVAHRLDERTFHLRANAYIQDHKELTLMAWADSEFHYTWVAPQDEQTRAIIGVPVTIQQEEDAARATKATRRPALTAQYVSIQGVRSVALYVPVFNGDQFLGTFSAFFSLAGLLEHSVPEWVQNRYEVSLVGPGGVVLSKRGGGGSVGEGLTAAKNLALPGSSQELSLRVARFDEGPDWELMLFAALTVGLALGVTIAVVELSRDNRQKRRVAAEMQRARDLAETASQSKTEFLANISHEIRTPIGAIIGYAETLLMQAGGQEAPPAEMLQAIRRNGQNLLLLINDLLDLTKVEAGLLEVDVREATLAEVVSEALLAIRPLADLKGLTLEVRCQDAVPAKLATDPTRLRQILVNVLSNAVKFTPKGRVTLAAKLDQRPGPGGGGFRLVLSVTDTGIGIGADQQARLFRNFGQADGSIARRFGGTGLGLSLSRKLARLLGGDLVLSRTEVGRGTTFTLSVPTGPLAGIELISELPLAVPPVPVGPRPGAARRLAGRRILVVEDGYDNQVIFREFLESEGGAVEICESGVQALRRIRAAGFPLDKAAFDVILMDVQMPGMDGYETTRELRASGFAAPIVALTAHAMKGERERCLDAGCDDYLAKPLDMELLIATVARWCGRGGGLPARESAAGAVTGRAPSASAAPPAPSVAAPADSPLISTLVHDARVRRVLSGFLERLPERLNGMHAALQAGDWVKLAQLAHALSGTAGSYGFPAISAAASDLEEMAQKVRDKAASERQLTTLSNLHHRARLGLKPTSIKAEGGRI